MKLIIKNFFILSLSFFAVTNSFAMGKPRPPQEKAPTLSYMSGVLDSQMYTVHIHSIAVDSSGNVYALLDHNYSIQKISPNGTVTTLAGNPQEAGSVDGSANQARFSQYLGGIAIDNGQSLRF